jgi:hypothetical protein
MFKELNTNFYDSPSVHWRKKGLWQKTFGEIWQETFADQATLPTGKHFSRLSAVSLGDLKLKLQHLHKLSYIYENSNLELKEILTPKIVWVLETEKYISGLWKSHPSCSQVY